MTSRPPSGARLHAAYWIAWYLPLVVLWLAFVDTVAIAEVVLGLVAAAVAATAAELVRAQGLVRFRLEWSWLRDLYRLPGLLLAQAYDRAIYFDLALALALLSFAGGMVFARFLERWI